MEQPQLCVADRPHVRVPLLSAKQMIEVDRLAVEETGPNYWQMTENAGRNLAVFAINRLMEQHKEPESASIVVCCGSGSNGSGGICAARHLANHNFNVLVCLSEPVEELGGAAMRQFEILQGTKFTTVSPKHLSDMNCPDIILDAILGYGLEGAPRGDAKLMIDWINVQNRAKCTVISLDIPSGLDATTGEAPGSVVKHSITLALALPKVGVFYASKDIFTFDLFLSDVGLPASVYHKLGFKDFRSPFDHRWIVPLSRQ